MCEIGNNASEQEGRDKEQKRLRLIPWKILDLIHHNKYKMCEKYVYFRKYFRKSVLAASVVAA